jgi:hypothetical protein
MRTTHPRPTSSIRTLGCLSALIALSLELVGCPDALRLPADSGGSASGGDPVPAEGAEPCDSNPDCTYPRSVCDAVKRTCVECLQVQDCATKPGTVCSLGQCACPTAAESFCSAIGSDRPYRCVDVKSAKDDCGGCNRTCLSACVAGVCSGAWEGVSLFRAPSGRTQHVAVSDADKVMIVWGGLVAGNQPTSTGGVYDLATNTWSETSSLNAPTPRRRATAVWDDVDKVMLVWGGSASSGASAPLNTGAMFDPKTNTWQPLPTDSAPSARFGHTAVWTGSKMIVWGGTDGTARFADGASYDPQAKTWTRLADVSMFGGRVDHTAVWTGTTMSIWGGFGFNAENMNDPEILADGAAYAPSKDGWDLLLTPNRPSARQLHSAVWTATAMLIWGGQNGPNALADGGKYEASTWSPLGTDAAPEGRKAHTAAWIAATGEMIVWGGENKAGGFLNSGHRIGASAATWTLLPTVLTPRARHTAVVAGSKMIIWGGDAGGEPTNTGAIFDAAVK